MTMDGIKDYDFLLAGFKMRVYDDDYDHLYAMSKRYKYNKQNWERALNYKYENEHDFIYTDYDCNGSTRVEITVKRKGKYMRIHYYWNKDV